MTKTITLITLALLLSCNKQGKISKEFNCSLVESSSLENIEDAKKLFTVNYPKHWKTSLYTDDFQSSIYTADTTKQLTESFLLDITYINDEIQFDTAFKLNQEQKNLSKALIQTKSKETTFQTKPCYYYVSKGQKSGYAYQVCNIFIKINDTNFILAKTEAYGDSLVNERFCKAINLIEQIKIY